MYNLAKMSLGNRALIALITIFAMVFGVITLGSLKQELIPRTNESEDKCYHYPRNSDGHNDPNKSTCYRAAINQSSVNQLAWNILEKTN